VFSKFTGLMVDKTWTRHCLYIKHQLHCLKLKEVVLIATEAQVTRLLNYEGLRCFQRIIIWREKILDPGSDVILNWNRILLFSCLTALFVDPLFFYLPSVTNKEKSSCMDTDLNLGITVTCFRTLADVFYIVHIVIKFRTAYVSPSSRVFGRGELVMDPKLIARRYLRSDFFIDLVAALPLPQVHTFLSSFLLLFI
jgi:hypothetical protein